MSQCATLTLTYVIKISGLIWDEWNRGHLSRHGITPEEVEEACHNRPEAIKSYRNRIQVSGKLKSGKRITIILSPEDRNLKSYGEETYYPITAFEG